MKLLDKKGRILRVEEVREDDKIVRFRVMI